MMRLSLSGGNTDPRGGGSKADGSQVVEQISGSFATLSVDLPPPLTCGKRSGQKHIIRAELPPGGGGGGGHHKLSLPIGELYVKLHLGCF